MQQTTFAIIKPDAVARNLCGEILAAMESAGLRIVGLKRLRLSKLQAAGFYAVHRERPFFESLRAPWSVWPCAVKTPLPPGAASWALLTRPRPNPAPCAASTAKAWRPTPYTAQTRPKPQPLNWGTSLTDWK